MTANTAAAISAPTPSLVDRVLSSAAFLPAVLALGAVLRALVLLIPLEQSSDFLWYLGRAEGIARGEGYHQGGVPTAFWPVGWPAVLGALFMVTGVSTLAAGIANLLMSLGCIWLAATLARRMFASQVAGNLTALILAVYPNQIGYVPLMSTEIFSTVLLLVSVLLLMRERPATDLLAGLVMGVATLTKTQSLLMPAFLFGALVLVEGRAALWPRLVALARVYIMLLLVVLPWTARNYAVFDTFILVSTNGGWTLLNGNNPEARGDYSPDTVLAEGYTSDPAQQVAMDRFARERAMEWIKSNPDRFLMLVPLKVFRLWAPDGEAEWMYQRGSPIYDAYSYAFRTVRVANQGFYVGILLLALPSFWILWLRRREMSPWAWAGIAFCLFTTAICIVFSGQSRYHFIVMPFLAGYAAWTLARWRARRAGAA